MKYLINLEKFFESAESDLGEFGRFLLYSSLGFMTTPQNEIDKTLPQFRVGGSENKNAIDMIQKVLSGEKITKDELQKLLPVLNHVYDMYDNQKDDPTQSLGLKVYLNNCKKKFGYESTILPDISDPKKYTRKSKEDLFQKMIIKP